MATEKMKINGIGSAGGILERIIERRLKRLEDARLHTPLAALREQCAASIDKRPSFIESLNRQGSVRIIAEVKKQSPSKGLIRADFNPLDIAEHYARAGAAAISVLTEEDFFGGSLLDLRAIREQVDVPLLRKDFIFDEYQIFEARLAGASAILLIAAVLDDELLAKLLKQTEELGMAALVEVHTEEEMHRAAQAGARLIGVNNRDLTTFLVTLETSIRLSPLAPKDSLLVSESGITSGNDIRFLRSAGYKAFLIGEHFMRQPDVGRALQTLIEDAN